MDPNKSTREEFTNAMVVMPVPEFASPEWKKYVHASQVLLDKLAHHSAMASNMQQTYMTPANSKNKVYFEWDFVGRTLSMFYDVNPTLQNLSKQEKEKWEDAVGRTMFTKMLILDTGPGMLDMMTETTYPEQKGAHPDFEEEILELARHLSD
ncbi:MAG: hypothetical protein LQ349_000131 [Xanthoria aureola]|nr:MAG: hypothetical protein LQ349_000131 [Xanthoria aureola]